MRNLNFVVWDSGFYISIKKTLAGAKPDSIVSCECCGEGCLGVKDPLSYKRSSNYLLLKKFNVIFAYGPQRTGIGSKFCQIRHFWE